MSSQCTKWIFCSTWLWSAHTCKHKITLKRKKWRRLKVSFCYGLNMKYPPIHSRTDTWFWDDNTNFKGLKTPRGRSQGQEVVSGSSIVLKVGPVLSFSPSVYHEVNSFSSTYPCHHGTLPCHKPRNGVKWFWAEPLEPWAKIKLIPFNCLSKIMETNITNP